VGEQITNIRCLIEEHKYAGPEMRVKIILKIAFIVIMSVSTVFSQWIPVNYDFIGKLLHVDKQNIIGGGPPFKRSTDGGRHWTTSATFGYFDSITSFDALGDTILVGSGGWFCLEPCSPLPSLFRSTNGGSSWDTVLSSGYGSPVAKIGDKYFFTNADGWLTRSSDGGNSWTKMPDDSIAVYNIYLIDTTLYVFGSQRLAATTDNGDSWKITQWMYDQINEIAGHDSILFITTDSGMYRSTDLGGNWTKFITGLSGIHQTVFTKNNLFALRNDSVYATSADHLNWSNVSEGIYAGGHPHLYTLATDSDYLYSGTDYGIWKRPIYEMITGINQQAKYTGPAHFSLYQNFPDPFNPATTIAFDLPRRAVVTLKVYNVLGQIVSTILDNEILDIGRHERIFDASEFSSGVYFYKLTAGNFIQTKKMIILR
jgi:hypothetical protein